MGDNCVAGQFADDLLLAAAAVVNRGNEENDDGPPTVRHITPRPFIPKLNLHNLVPETKRVHSKEIPGSEWGNPQRPCGPNTNLRMCCFHCHGGCRRSANECAHRDFAHVTPPCAIVKAMTRPPSSESQAAALAPPTLPASAAPSAPVNIRGHRRPQAMTAYTLSRP